MFSALTFLSIIRALMVPLSLWLMLGAAWAQSVPCTGITLRPTDVASINSTINSQPNGTTFCFESGTYNITTAIQAKDGNKLICKTPRTCIVDGRNTISVGFMTAYSPAVENIVRGFVVKNFTNSCMRLRVKGRAENNDVSNCEYGIDIAGSAVGNYIHHNRRYGISGGPANGILIENNEISFNNTSKYDPGWAAGGSKIVGSTAGSTVTWRGNKVHDNYGNGIWQDGNVKNSLIENNEVYNNYGVGIFQELSWTAVIRNNTIYNNSLSTKNTGRSCWWGAQIELNDSQNTEIYGNTITAEYVNGICLVSSDRSETAPYPTSLANVKVYNNTIKMRGTVRTGVVGNQPATGISFYGNSYYVNNLSGTFWSYMSDKTKPQWQAAGQDTAGTFTAW